MARAKPRGPLPLVVLAMAAMAVMGALTACKRPPVGPPPTTPPTEGRVGPVAFETFAQDRPAIAGKWYDYNPQGHTLDPKAQTWIVVDDTPNGDAADGPGIAAFRIESVYDPDTADSGVFTLTTVVYDAASSAWGAQSQWTSSKNIKLEGPVCLRLRDDSEQDCAGTDWQLRFAIFNYFSPLAGIAIADPGVFVRSVDGTDAYGSVRIARIDAANLGALPDPATLATLGDADAPFDDTPADDTEWSFDKLGPDLPRAGMAIGARFADDGFVGRDDVWWLMSFRYELLRFTVKPVVDGNRDAGLHFTFTSTPLERSDYSIAEDLPADRSVDVAIPAVGAARYLTFTTDDMQLPSDDLAGAAFPYAAPKTTLWDLAIERPSDDDVRLLLSPTACVLNATQLGLSEATPPTSTETP